ncbi:hypothetical protein Rrhod_2737 [Rhodococcus rhodnii LMG 5362]|uniref:Uncharacterized protein n=1 Tax=Rhodococcus rhodnii LMG 5362 TaxID=1273125 RepID=R7WKJ6_9NOCA|nr:hypothetical protein Rrhod_2737 [Rhodococcus rhodnii LMG 5362]
MEQQRARDLQKYGYPDWPCFEELVEKTLSRGLVEDEIYQSILGSFNRTKAEVNKKVPRRWMGARLSIRSGSFLAIYG